MRWVPAGQAPEVIPGRAPHFELPSVESRATPCAMNRGHKMRNGKARTSVVSAVMPFGDSFSESQRDSVLQPGGCRVREATPGLRGAGHSTPTGLRHIAATICCNPVGVEVSFAVFSQGSRCAPTLGWMTQSRWDWELRPLAYPSSLSWGLDFRSALEPGEQPR